MQHRVCTAIVPLAMASALGLIVVSTAYPFELRTERAAVRRKIDGIDWRLSLGRVDRDMVQNVLLMAPLGLVIACVGRARRPHRVAVEAALVALVVSSGVEALQVLLPGRCPQLPDVLRNVCGCVGAGGIGAVLRGAPVPMDRPDERHARS